MWLSPISSALPPASSLITEASVTARGARRSSPSGADRTGIGDDPTGIRGMWLLIGDRRARDLGAVWRLAVTVHRLKPMSRSARRRACGDRGFERTDKRISGGGQRRHSVNCPRLETCGSPVLVAGGPTRHVSRATFILRWLVINARDTGDAGDADMRVHGDRLAAARSSFTDVAVVAIAIIVVATVAKAHCCSLVAL